MLEYLFILFSISSKTSSSPKSTTSSFLSPALSFILLWITKQESKTLPKTPFKFFSLNALGAFNPLSNPKKSLLSQVKFKLSPPNIVA